MSANDEIGRVARALGWKKVRQKTYQGRTFDNYIPPIALDDDLPAQVVSALHASGADIEAFCREMERGE